MIYSGETKYIYIVGGGIKKDGTLILANFASNSKYYPGSTFVYKSREWEVIGVLPNAN